MKWKDVKNLYICSLHFESYLFRKRLNPHKQNPKTNSSTSVPEQPGSSNHDHDYGPRNLQTSATTVTEQTGQSNNFNLDHDYVCMKIVRTYVSMKSDQLNCHEHAFELVKKIISTYVVLRLKHHMKEENERIKKKRIRSRLSKLIIFKGQ